MINPVNAINSNVIIINNKKATSKNSNINMSNIPAIEQDGFTKSRQKSSKLSFGALTRAQLDSVYNQELSMDVANDIEIEDFSNIYSDSPFQKKMIRRYYYDDKFKDIVQNIKPEQRSQFFAKVQSTENNIVGTFEYWCKCSGEIEEGFLEDLINIFTDKKDNLIRTKLFHPAGLFAIDPGEKLGYFDKFNSEYISSHLTFKNEMINGKELLFNADQPYEQLYATRAYKYGNRNFYEVIQLNLSPELFNDPFKDVGDGRLYNELLLIKKDAIVDITQRQMYEFLAKIKGLAEISPQNVIYLKQNMNKAFDSFIKNNYSTDSTGVATLKTVATTAKKAAEGFLKWLT